MFLIPALSKKVPVLAWVSYSTRDANFRSMAMFRILFAVLLLIDYFFNILPNYEAFFMDSGILPVTLQQRFSKPGYFSILPLSNSWLFHGFIQSIYVMALFAFLAGYKTRWANLIVFVIYASLYWRNTFLIINADVLIRTLLLFSFFLPLNRYWAVDAALETQDRLRPHPLIPLVCIKLQISMIYLFSGLYKIGIGETWLKTTWLNGTAVDIALRDDFFGAPLGTALVDNFDYLAMLLSYAIPLFQIAFVFLLYSPVLNNLMRLIAITGAIIMHASFILFMRVGLFPYICLIYLMLLVPDEWWSFVVDRRRSRFQKMKVYYDPDCVLCRKLALLLRELCLDERVPVLSSSSKVQTDIILKDHGSWIACAADGNVYSKWEAVSRILKQSVIFYPLGYLADLRFLRSGMGYLYRLFEKRRIPLGRAASLLLPWHRERQQAGWQTSLCLLMTVVMIQYSFMTLPQAQTRPPQWLADAARVLQVEQEWSIFAPDPVSLQRLIVITAVFDDGSIMRLDDVIRLPFTFNRETGKWDFENQRWMRYIRTLAEDQSFRILTHAYLDYLCRSANRAISDTGMKITRIDFYSSYYYGRQRNAETTPANEIRERKPCP